MTQAVRWRPQGTIEYDQNNVKTLELSRGMLYRELMLRLEGQPTVTGGNNSTANTGRGDEWACVKRIRLVVNGTDILFDMDGNALRMWNLFYTGRPAPVTPDLGDGTQANPIFGPYGTAFGVDQGSILWIPIWMANSIKPIDTLLDSRSLQSVKLEIQWGSHDDVNSAATGWTTEPRIKVKSLESIGGAEFPIGRKFASWRRFKIEQDVVASNPQYEVDLPVNRVYRGFLINTTVDDADSPAVITNIRLRSGTTDFFNMDQVTTQYSQQIRTGRSNPFDAGALAYDPVARSADSDINGWTYVDLVTDGRLREAVDALGLAELKLELDITKPAGTVKVNVYPSTVIPVRPAA